MSFKYQKSKPDSTTSTIVEELRNRQYIVYYVGKPTDLLVRHPSWPLNTWRLLECKSPSGKAGTLKLRKDQEDQQKFCAAHGVPYAISPLEALHAMGEVVTL